MKNETNPISIKSPTILEWSGPSRPYKKRDKSFFQTIVAIVFLLVVILFFIREWLIIGVALAVAFLGYVLATVPPPEITYKLTKRGVWIDDIFYEYSRLTQFWFEKHLENTVLVLLAPERRNPRILLVVPHEMKNEVKKELLKSLEFRSRPLKTLVDKLGDWMSRAIPLEDSDTKTK